MRTIPTVLIGLTGLAPFINATALPAQGPILVEGNVPTAIVSYADLNIANPAGLRALNGRVQRAASDLCLSSRQRVSLDRWAVERGCYDFAIADAQRQIDRAVADEATRVASRGMIRVAAR